MSTKQCSFCGGVKPKTEFGRNRQTLDGLNYYCKPCAALKHKQWVEQNPERDKAAKSKYKARLRATNILRGDPYGAPC